MLQSFYILDGHASAYQAFYGLTSLHSPDGTPTNAVFGFIKMLQKILAENDPQYVAVCFDMPKKTFRHESFEDYKANRKPMPDDLQIQIPIIQEILRAMRIPVFMQEGYEADDLMATIVECCKDIKTVAITIVSPDKDITQLIQDRVQVLDPKQNCLVHRMEILEKFHLEPEQLPEYFALIGDTSDNIPGVPGIGPKRARRLLAQWPTLEKLYEHLGNVEPLSTRKTLDKYHAEAFLSRQLFQLNRQAPIAFDLEQCRRQKPEQSQLIAWYQKLGLRTLLSELLEKSDAPKEQESSILIWLIQTTQELEQLRDILSQQSQIYLDIEISQDQMIGLAFGWMDGKIAFVECNPLGLKDVLSCLKPVLCQGPKKYGHDLKRIVKSFMAHRLHLQPLGMDTMIAGYLLSPTDKEYSLDDLAIQYLACHAPAPLVEEPSDGFWGSDQSTHPAHFAAVLDLISQLCQKLVPILKEQNLLGLLENIELRLIPILAEMEFFGIAVDPKVLAELAQDLKQEIQKIETEIYQVAGEPFNITSTQQLGRILFEKLQLPKGKKTKTGYTTNADTLEQLAAYHPLPVLILEYRQMAKLLGTYVETLPSLIHPKTKRIHTTFHQTGTATGRLSSSDPNLQNIPIRTDLGSQIRKAFVARPEYCLIAADYSQIELRVLAHFSQDPNLMAAFVQKADIHSAVAASLFGVAQNAISSEQRRIAKAVNFGIIYGQTSFGLAQELKIPIHQAQNFIDSYFAHFQGVTKYIAQLIEQTKTLKYVQTIANRRRPIPEILSENHNIQKLAERVAVNTVMQGSAADLIKLAMIELAQSRTPSMPFSILLQIHDELVVECALEHREYIQNLLTNAMLSAAKILNVPVEVKVAFGPNWQVAHA